MPALGVVPERDVKPTPTTQPYRKGPRQPGQALDAMLRGRDASGYNPQDIQRASMLVAAGKRRAGRSPRSPRQPRGDRPPR